MKVIRSGSQGRFGCYIFGIVLLGAFISGSLAAAQECEITAADKGGLVRVKLGAAFQLRLPSNPSTGYLWYVEKDSTPLIRMVKQWQAEAAQPGVGRPVFQIFRFEGKRRGVGLLKMHYLRSWEPPAPDEEKFEIRVSVE